MHSVPTLESSVWQWRTQDNSQVPKMAHLGAPQILKFLCLRSGTHSVMEYLTFLYGCCAPALMAHPRSCQDGPYFANWRPRTHSSSKQNGNGTQNEQFLLSDLTI